QMNIKLKEEHTYGVCENIVMIGKDKNLDEEQLQIGETIALFHDIGRFEQFKRYRTFNDRRSQNHAELSVEILKRTGVLTRLPKEETIIYKAISYHNLYKLPAEEVAICLFYARLLRDADKLDIWSTITEYYGKRHLHPNPALELELPDTQEYSPHFIDSIMNCRCTDMGNIKTYNDMKLSLLSWVFDINFLPTYHYIQHHGYIDRVVDSLPDTEDIRKAQEHINRYIKRKLTNNNSVSTKRLYEF
ncbi:MAG: HD domain-containing protein, partial [Thermoplasmatales archaeon]|nr:HD domain-containing protein [Thermoplasmatales archaeon]